MLINTSVTKIQQVEQLEKKRNASQVIRLRKGDAANLAKIAAKLDTTQGQLVSWAVKALIELVESSGDTLTLPLDFSSIKGRASEVARSATMNGDVDKNDDEEEKCGE